MRRGGLKGLSRSLIFLVVILGLSSCALSCTPPETEEGLLILSHSTYVDSLGYFRLVGEVENTGQSNTEKNNIVATFYDEQGESNLTASCYCCLEIIRPGERSPFEIVLPSRPDGLNYVLTTKCQVTDIQPNREVVAHGIEAMTDPDGYYTITGQVTNAGEKPIDVIMIVGSFYDSEGTIVAAGIAFADATPLQPDESANFTMVIDPGISVKINSYSLQLVAYD